MKSTTLYIFITCAFLFSAPVFAQQKVGLVLSGGGATGLAHIGVLKALEERGIPIDYITGTSAGALIGAMYSIGYTPEEIESYVLTDDFQLMVTGKTKPSQQFLLREESQNASMVSLLFTYNNLLKRSLPTNFITSAYLDYEMLKNLGTAGASCGGDFDSLFIPFRCVSSDISNKKSVVFSEGHLNQAVRTSMTFPFYFSPLKIDGNLLFDGGLYNNFPADVMYQEFSPDFIIGSNVSDNAEKPSEDDLISQVVNMLVSHSDFTIPCEYGIIIRPKTDVSTFDFESVQQAISDGYLSAQSYLDSIEQHIEYKVSAEELKAQRQAFRSKLVPLQIESISTTFEKNNKGNYVQKSVINPRREKILSAEQFEKRYYRLYASSFIDFLYPTIELKTDSSYHLNLEVRKSKEFKLDVGGHFSSRAINTGYLGLSFRSVRKSAITLHAESYFGKFYGSINTEMIIEIPSVYPVSITPYFVMNRWDYFHNFATFFEDVKPSFLIQNERYFGAKFSHPIGNTTKSIFDYRNFNLENDYYQTSIFTNKDTSDITFFNGNSISWELQKNSLNRKQFATSGHYFSAKARFVGGKENTIGGSTNNNEPHIEYHSWLNLSAEIQTFVIDHPVFHLGLHARGVMNSQALFQNYTATLLSISSFSPLVDAETYFLPEYRSPQHIGTGINLIFTVKKKIDFRLDAYYYQPFVKLVENKELGSFGYSKPFKGESVLASLSAIYHSFIGPIRATVNYFPQQVQPLAFQVSYGYVLFNERAIR